mmetsp:Transcript_23004/g.42723  ORF Transcript_23004/g.42723 Transcript_23004/m.42723 type:complete len:511 (-) Transcript_23004:308-1840(-)
MDQPPAMEAAAAADANISNLVLPQGFLQDPAVFLTSLASQPPSRQGLAALAGPISKWFIAAAPRTIISPEDASSSHPAAQVAGLYLQAASVQLRDDARAGDDVQQEMATTQHQYETLEAVGAAATLCQSRMAIASSGILPTLAQLMLHSQTAADAVPPEATASSNSSRPSLSSAESVFSPTSSASFPPLQQVSVEFLQCCIIAEHHRYAERFIRGTWPRPSNTVNIRTVLRYYYLRGIVHMGCGDYAMAHRCWWTCLSVPAEICSTIMIHAWKKLSLVQPLLDRSRGTNSLYHDKSSSSSQKATTRFPACMAKCMARMLTSGKESKDEAVMLYTQLGPAAEMGNVELVRSLIQTHESLLKKDGNYGLALVCLKRAQGIQVWQAARLFSIVSMTQLAQRWKILPEQVPQRLIDSEVPCRLEDDGMVVFALNDASDDNNSNNSMFHGAHTGLPQPINDPSTSSPWIDLSEWMQLLERMQRLDAGISTSSKYHALKKEEKSSSAGEASSIADF